MSLFGDSGGEDDYLKSGSVKAPSILAEDRFASSALGGSVFDKKNENQLYLEGYGRGWGEKTTYSVGLCYGVGMAFGSLYGTLVGIRKGGATPKLFLNSIMNGASTKGPYLANQGAIMTLYYVLGNQFIAWARGEDDDFNAPIGGAFAGALYKSTSRSWMQVSKYSAAAMVAFSSIDQAVKKGYL